MKGTTGQPGRNIKGDKGDPGLSGLKGNKAMTEIKDYTVKFYKIITYVIVITIWSDNRTLTVDN